MFACLSTSSTSGRYSSTLWSRDRTDRSFFVRSHGAGDRRRERVRAAASRGAAYGRPHAATDRCGHPDLAADSDATGDRDGAAHDDGGAWSRFESRRGVPARHRRRGGQPGAAGGDPDRA